MPASREHRDKTDADGQRRDERGQVIWCAPFRMASHLSLSSTPAANDIFDGDGRIINQDAHRQRSPPGSMMCWFPERRRRRSRPEWTNGMGDEKMRVLRQLPRKQRI